MTKTVRVKDAVALYIASVLGGGVLVLPSLVADTAGPAAIVSWILVTLLSVPMSIMFGRLCARYPDAGGMSGFIGRAFGTHMGNLAAWLYFFVLPIGQPAIALTGIYYFAYLLDLSDAAIAALAYGILCVAVLLGLLGKRLNATIQTAIVLAIMVVLVGSSAFGLSHMEADHFTPFNPHGLLAIGGGVALILWSYIGVENLSFISSDFENPKRDFLRSVMIGTAVVAFLYITTSIVTIGVLTPAEWGIVKAPFALIVERSIGFGSGYIVVSISLFIALAGAIAIVWGGSNLCVSMARGGSLPEGFARQTKAGVPRRAILFLWVMYTVSIIAIYVFNLDLGTLARVVGATVLVTYIASALASLKLMQGERWSAILTLLGCLALLPFFGGALWYPAGIVIAYLCYLAVMRPTFQFGLQADGDVRPEN